MNIFQEVLVSYDIQNNKDRTKIYETLKDIGLHPIQKSVFWGYVNPAEKRAIQRIISMSKSTDSIFLINSNLKKNQQENSKGLDDDIINMQPTGYKVL